MARSLLSLEGVIGADVNFASGMLLVEHEAGVDAGRRVIEVVRSTGHGIEPLGVLEAGAEERAPRWRERRLELAVAGGGALIALGWALSRAGAGDLASTAAYALAILAGGTVAWRRAVVSLRARILDMNVLMSVAVIGAAAIGEWQEAASVIVLFALGGLLESRSLERTRRSIRDLMDLAPRTVHVLRGGAEVELTPSEARVGETMVVRPGERLALDGVVTSGESAVDESAVTGESLPAEKAPGARVFAGTLNTTGLLEVEVTALAEDTTLSRVIFLVEEAQASRAPVQTLVERFTRWYTPTVVGLAVAVATVPPLVSASTGAAWGGFGEWFYRALVLLVVSCPCALVLSTPVAIVSAITRASRDGVLVKGGAHLETASRVGAVAFDKTGTLTIGRAEVAGVTALAEADAAEVLARAAALERASTHPLARAVVRAAGQAGALAEEVAEEPGRGVRGRVGGVRHAVGSPAFVAAMGALDAAAAEEVARCEGDGRTALVLAETREGERARALGVIAIADEVRADARDAVSRLRSQGIAHLAMLTGDNERTATAVAGRAGVTSHMAGLLPADKVDAVRRLKERYGTVAMVGDGVNDAPALAAADIGIAMGAAGSDTALEAADVALLADDLSALPGFFDLGRRTLANVRQNVAVSIAVKLAVLTAAVAGHAPLWAAVFADTGVALLVIANGLRLLRARGAGAGAPGA